MWPGTSTEQELLVAALPMSMPAMRGRRLGCSMLIELQQVSTVRLSLSGCHVRGGLCFIKLGLRVSLIDQAHLSTFWPWRPWRGHPTQ